MDLHKLSCRVVDLSTSMTYLISRRPSGEAYFMCAATLITPTVTFAQKQHSWDKMCFPFFKVLVSAAHCFNENWEDSSWYQKSQIV